MYIALIDGGDARVAASSQPEILDRHADTRSRARKLAHIQP
jgi:hypothetical protein